MFLIYTCLAIFLIVFFARQGKKQRTYLGSQASNFGISNEDEDYVDKLYQTNHDVDELEELRIDDDDFMDEFEELLQSGEITSEYDADEWLEEVETQKLYDIKKLRRRVIKRLQDEDLC